MPVVLLKPWFGVATPDAYGRWRDAAPLPGVDFGPQASVAGELVNDLERPVFSKHLFLAELKEWLRGRNEVEAALMSGSGSTVFGVLFLAEIISWRFWVGGAMVVLSAAAFNLQSRKKQGA